MYDLAYGIGLALCTWMGDAQMCVSRSSTTSLGFLVVAALGSACVVLAVSRLHRI
jgi:hypothetical protein